MRLLLFILYSVLATTEPSKCPESRKPHTTSCTIFYNCVNLPAGGYVWVPSKCTENLIFEPYLRMCVLPGDSWTCDTLSTESSLVTNRYDIPDLINPNETSYLGSTEDPLNFAELIDSSYTTDTIPDSTDQGTATPYPLIEVQGAMENIYESSYNGSAIGNTQDGYLQTQDNNKKQYSMLNQLIHHLLIYKEITIPLEFLASLLISTPSRHTSNAPSSNYLIQNYIQQNNNLQNTVITGAQLQSTTEYTTLKEAHRSESMPHVKNRDDTTSQPMLDVLDDENSIILLDDSVKNKQYMTIEKYKSLSYHVDPQFVHVIPCIKNVRMPNITECVKYYVCDPKTAFVLEYTCPLFTAFNKYARTCDRETYNKCMENKNNREIENFVGVGNVAQTSKADKNICTEHGKTKDPTSDSRYYICYSASDNSHAIKSMRMTCPNGLIFCQIKKVCTTKRLCKTA